MLFRSKCTALYDPASEVTVRWNDPAIGIRWPLAEPVLSPKDRAGKTLNELKSVLEAFGKAPARGSSAGMR